MVRRGIVLLLLMGAGALFLFFWFGSSTGDRDVNRLQSLAVVPRGADKAAQPAVGLVATGSPDTANSDEAGLAEVESRLADFEAGCNGWISLEFKCFVEETVARYPFSPELFVLIEWIYEKNMKATGIAFDTAIRRILTGPSGLESRRRLVQALNEKHLGRMAHTWCRYAGEGSSSEEAGALAASLEDSGLKRAFDFGRNRSLAATEPLTAVKATVAWLTDPSAKGHVYSELPEIIKSFPAGVNFAEIERLLPAPGKVRDPELDYVRSLLFQQWGGSDPAGAANYVVSNSDRLGSELMSNVVQRFSQEHPAEAIQWIQEFSPGPYFDSAASMVILQIAQNHPDTAKELAELISDPAARSKALSDAGIAESGNGGVSDR